MPPSTDLPTASMGGSPEDPETPTSVVTAARRRRFMSVSEHIAFVVNGTPRELDVEPRRLLVQALREDLDLTGTHVGCDTSQCGACTVHVDGRAIKSCTMLAVQADGAEVLTIEGLADGDTLHPMQAAFWEKHGLQCGFCTPGMIMTAVDLLSTTRIRPTTRSGTPSRATSAAAPATRTSSRRSATRPRPCGPARPSPRRAGEARDDHRSRPRRPRGEHQAGRGPALHHRRRQLRRRHQARLDGPHGHPAQPVRARQHPLDRHGRGQGDAGRRRRVRRCRHPVQPDADGLAGRWQRRDPEQRQHAPDARHGQRQVDRRGRRGGRRRDRGAGVRRARGDRRRLRAAARGRRRRQGDRAGRAAAPRERARTTSSSSGASATRPGPTPPSTAPRSSSASGSSTSA